MKKLYYSCISAFFFMSPFSIVFATTPVIPIPPTIAATCTTNTEPCVIINIHRGNMTSDKVWEYYLTTTIDKPIWTICSASGVCEFGTNNNRILINVPLDSVLKNISTIEVQFGLTSYNLKINPNIILRGCAPKKPHGDYYYNHVTFDVYLNLDWTITKFSLYMSNPPLQHCIKGF